ncbi:hypothetical protein [Arcobacter sp. FWKO B]|uniref:hypothetical protein n=1 Tax=Arcobacter sp. FWKO B TaxID=2593672 RepID=UPI0018A3DC59|nr:hypothetical protein [Arcobacter sp. FWKO B]QOG11230.1 hypothetical protein FWKOB_00350 [Arcobacter sp. FWKO B]
MVRLVITDFGSREASETFYRNDEFDTFEYLITYSAFKKHSVYLSKYYINNSVYSLNLLSKYYLEKNEFLIYINEEEYIILFNHKTVYSAKINQHFITDDIIKSVLITKHIILLSGAMGLKKVYYVIDGKYKYAIENILKYNTLDDNKDVVLKPLGKIKNLVKPLNELNRTKLHYLKLGYVISLVVILGWFGLFGLNMASDALTNDEYLAKLKSEVDFENQVLQRQQNILNIEKKKLDELIGCISNNNEVQR